MKILLYANFNPPHIGRMFQLAAESRGWETARVDRRAALSSSRILNRMSRMLRGGRPPHLGVAERELLRVAREFRPDFILTTGVQALSANGVRQLHRAGFKVANYLTDDPWNPCNAARYAFDALPEYDKVFSTKTSIMHDLERCGVSNAEYLPFAYCPEDHRPVAPTAERQCDVLYVGGADADRRTLFAPIVADREIRGCFCGGYWDAYPEFRPFAGGHLDAAAYRTAVASAKINVVNGRKANRDQHAMRSFEIPAMGGCMILEDTSEHRRLFGEEGECALYYSTPEELHEKVRRLLKDENLRQRLATAAHRKIMDGGHSYADRLVTMGRELGILN